MATAGVDNRRRLCYLARLWRGRHPSAPKSVYSTLGSPEQKGPEEGLVIVQIFVRDNNVDQALKALKKKMQREGTFREMKRHVAYEKPSEKRARQQAEAVRRARKLARKRMQREGLLPPPKPKPPGRLPASPRWGSCQVADLTDGVETRR
jgi:small subunit ribosomal protein S21